MRSFETVYYRLLNSVHNVGEKTAVVSLEKSSKRDSCNIEFGSMTPTDTKHRGVSHREVVDEGHCTIRGQRASIIDVYGSPLPVWLTWKVVPIQCQERNESETSGPQGRNGYDRVQKSMKLGAKIPPYRS